MIIPAINHITWTVDLWRGQLTWSIRLRRYPITTDCLQPEKGNCLSHAVCDDSVALMPLLQINRALFSDDGDTAGRSGHNRDDGGSPARLLGYLPRCLYWLWSLHAMTQCQAKIKGPSVNRLTRVIVDDGG